MSSNQDFVIEDDVLREYNGPGGAVVIPDGLTCIGDSAFEGCTGLTHVAFPDGLTEIGERAFEGCTGLTQVAFPDGLTEIGWYTFEGCTGLTQVEFPDGLTKIGWSAFESCTGLTQVTFPDGLTSIGECAFESCTGLTQIAFPDGLAEIENWAFKGCTGLTQAAFPAGLTSIGDWAFEGCTGLTQVAFPDSLTKIGWGAFLGCTGLTQVEPKLMRTVQKLPAQIASLVHFADGEDLAYIVLYQTAKAWQEEVHERVERVPALAVDAVSAMTDLLAAAKRPKKAEWERAAAFVLAWQEKIGAETLRAFYDLAREKKAPVLSDLERDSGMCKRITVGSGQEEGRAAQLPENLVEGKAFGAPRAEAQTAWENPVESGPAPAANVKMKEEQNMNKSPNYPWIMYSDFFLLAGPREEAQAILNEEAVFAGRAVQEVGSGGAYALFYVDWKEDVDSGQWDHLKERLGRNPRCEAALVLYTGTWYWSEKPLNDRWTGGEWYDDSWDEYAPPWADLLLKGGARAGSLVVRGSEAVQWPTGGGSGDWLEGGTLSVARLAELCNPYVKPVKSREFYQKFRKELPGFDGVSAIELTQVEKEWVGGDDEALARLSKLEGAAEAGDLTRLRYIDSYVSTKTTWLCNLETREVVKRVLVSLHVPQDPAAGECRYVNLTLDKREVVCKPLAGIPVRDEADLLWDGGTCRFCFSNRERLVVPAQNPDTGEPAQAIGDMCFQGVDQVKRVVLPNTVTALGTGAFSGCKKLEYVSFQDDPDSKADFVLRKKGDLLALFTKKTAYEIPKDVTKIGKFAFSSCNKLKSVTLHGKLKPLLKDSLAGCKSLKTVVLQPDVKAVEWLSLARGNIQTVVLADGTQVHIYDTVSMYNCFTQSEAGIGFDYAKAAQLWQGVKKESSRFQFCMELLTEHAGDCGAELKAIVDFAIRYAIGKGDMKSLDVILKAQPGLELDTEKLVDLANRSGQTEAAAMLLNHRAAEPEEKKRVVRRETPAEHKWPWFRYIQVRFENNKAYKYRCDFDVRAGDKVFVEGKMAGHPGEVTAILQDRPSGRAELYTQSVTEAYNVTTEEVDSLFSLD